MRETFIPKTFNPKHRELITSAQRIMANYQRQGYDLSLRQLYYQFVAHEGFPNTEANYKLLGNVISDARLAGELDWDMLVDRGRSTVANSHWDSPADIVDAAASSYRIDLWETQPWHVEVMVEKQALEGVLVPVCRRLDVPFTSNKGYSSSSAMYSAGKRLEEMLEIDKKVAIIYLGDHDPSGIDMSRDVEERLMLFSRAGEMIDRCDRDEDEDGATPKVRLHDFFEGRFEVQRIALNMDQVRAYNPPPNPAKLTDSRARGYIANYGRQSWELDALEPSVLAQLVTDAVENYIDDELMEEAKEKMQSARDLLKNTAQEFRKAEELKETEEYNYGFN